MDPTETLLHVADDTLPLSERIEAIHALLDWLENGGFSPDLTDFLYRTLGAFNARKIQ